FAQASHAAVAQIQASVATKQALVKVDLYDQGPRRKLNLGHTFGHALEALSLGSMTHGEAVGLGLLCAARIAAASDLENTLRQTLVRWGLPTVAPTPAAELATQLARDKKRSGQLLTIVELHAPGQVTLRGGVDEATVLKAFAAVT
ncbi:MAG: 3-dehydroquinate synthetase, partial [Pseudohongiellaceae bacterium]